MYNIIMSVIYEIVIAVTISVIAININVLKTTKKNTLIFTGILFLADCFIHYFGFFKAQVPMVTIIIFIYFYLLYKKILYSVMISVFTLFILALGDAVGGIILLFVFKKDFSQIWNNINVQLLTATIIFFLSYAISKIAKIFFKKVHLSNVKRINTKSNLLLVTCLITPLIALYSFVMVFKNLQQTSNKIIVVLNLLFVISLFIFLILIIYQNNKGLKRELEKQYNEKELYQLKEYTNMIEIMSTDLREFKHDYLNILQTIGEYIESENMEELKEFYEKDLMPESKRILVKDRSFLLLQHIKINPLKSLISSKIIKAQTKNIKIKIEIAEDIDELRIKLIDICRIVGILIDNAIEAAVLCEDKFIEFAIIKVDTSVTFIINNSCHEDTPPVFKIYEKGFSIKGPGRGIGLKSVREILDQNYRNVLLNTKIEASIFKQELIILDRIE